MLLRPISAACVLAGITLLLYGDRLTAAPIGADEAIILQESQLQGGDEGRRLPMFFHVGDTRWMLPIPVYATAIVRSLGGGDASTRLVTVFVAALDVALISLCAGLLFKSNLALFAAAILLMLTPAHLVFGRFGTDAIYPLPFVLGALLAILNYLETDRPWLPVTAGALLGAGVYTHRSAPLTMAFLMVTCGSALIVNRRVVKPAILMLGGFVILMLPAAAWIGWHPETYPDTFGRWAIHLAHIRNPLDGVDAFLNRNTLGTRASFYWGFLDPAWLFLSPTAPFLAALLPALAVGIATWRRRFGPDLTLLIAGGAVVAPLAGSSFGEPGYAAQAAVFLPFAVLLMTAGALHALRQPSTSWRFGTVMVALLMLVEVMSVFSRSL